MIMQICVKCGYHPTYPRLAKLIVKVYRNALISYVLQATNFQDIIINGIDKLVKGAISIVPGVKEITSSLTQGAANALLTLRIGILTRKYLYEEYSKQEKITQKEDIEVEIVEASLNEANENIDSIIKLCKDNVKEEVKV
jgi:hypothetical protein